MAALLKGFHCLNFVLFFFFCRFSGETQTLRIRSVVGLLPLLASIVLEDALVQKLPGFKRRLSELLQSRPDLANEVFYSHNIS